MARKISLPPRDVVQKWNAQKVVKWLKKVQLEDCVPAFQNRRIDGTKLLELTEQKLFSFQDMKIKHRGQISKCVNECKSQASNAKRIVGTIRQNKSRGKSTDTTVENGDDYDSEDEFDYWDSDFDEDFDDEGSEENIESEVNLSSKNPTEVKTEECISSEISENNSSSETVRTKFIPKPPDIPVVPSTFSTNSQKVSQRNGIPRPPLKRPPSQPPPPPVAQVSSPPAEGPLEDYEIPIGHLGISQVPSAVAIHEPTLTMTTSLSDTSSFAETYEVIEPPEENYEIVESPPLPLKAEKPVLPPRLLTTVSRPCVPPPLPQKPKKFQEVVDKGDGYRSLNRPKLPLKQEDEDSTNGTSLSSASGIGSVILNSFLGRRNSMPSPKLNSRLKDSNSSDAESSGVGLNSSSCSQSSSPEKEGLFTVGSSAFINSAAASSSNETIKSAPHFPLDANEVAQNMATRPLPPVPQVQSNESLECERDVSSFAWFHEIERQEAEQKVQSLKQSGAFLVRPSKRAGKDNPYSITILYDEKIFHLNIRLRPEGTFALGKEKPKEKYFPTVAALIMHYQNEPILLTSRGEAAGRTTLHVFPEK